MKYDDKPSVDIERARSFIVNLNKKINDADIKTDHEMLGLIIENLTEYFSKLGKTNVEEEWVPKNGIYPRSDNMNKIMEALVNDLYEVFAEQSQLGLELSKVENFTETQRSIIDNLRNIIKTKIFDSEVSSVSNESNEYWAKDTFISDRNVNFDTGKTSSRTMLDTNEGAITLKKDLEVQIPITGARWSLNMNETVLTLGRGNQEWTTLAKDLPVETLNLYNGQRYGIESLTPSNPNGDVIIPGEPWMDNPLATLESALSGIGSETFDDDLRSEFEIVFGELGRVGTAEAYIKSHIAKTFGTQFAPRIESKLMRSKGNTDCPKYMPYKVNNVKMVASLTLELETATPISKVHTFRSVNEKSSGYGPNLITGITVYDEGAEPLSEEDTSASEKQEVAKTFTSDAPAKFITIQCTRATQDLSSKYLPYTVYILPIEAKVSSGTVKIVYRRFVVSDASRPKRISYNKSTKKISVEGIGVYQRK